MSFLKRLNLRQNWPLWAAGISLIVVILYWLDISFFANSYKTPVIYPLIVNREPITFVFVGLIVVVFLSIEFRSFVIIKSTQFVWLIGLCLLTGLCLLISTLLWIVVSPIGCCLIGIALVVLSLVTTRHSVKTGLASLIILPAVGIAAIILVIGSILSDFQHLNTVWFNEQRYNLLEIIRKDTDPNDCVNYYFVAYKCDSLSLICYPIYNTRDRYKCWSTASVPTNARLIVDPTKNVLYFQIGDKRTLIAK